MPADRVSRFCELPSGVVSQDEVLRLGAGRKCSPSRLFPGANKPETGDRTLLLHHAGTPTATFDLDLAVSDRAGNVASSADQQPLADREFTIEVATYLGLLDGCVTLELATLGDLHLAAVMQSGFQTAFHHQTIAGFDISGEKYAAADNHGTRFARLPCWAVHGCIRCRRGLARRV